MNEAERLILRAVVEEGRVNVTEASVRQWLRQNAAMDKQAASVLLRETRIGLQQKNLISLSTGSEGERISLHEGNAAAIVAALKSL